MKEVVHNIRIYYKEYLLEHKKEIVRIFFLLIASISISIILPIIVSIFIDNLNSSYDHGFFYKLSCIYLILLIIKIIVEAINSYISECLGWTISNKLKINLVKHCVNLDFTFHNKHKTGEMIERVDGDVSFLSNFFSEFIVNILGNTIFVAAIIIIFYIQSGFIGVGYSIITILAYCAILSLQNKISMLWSKYREDEAQLYGYLQESVAAREDIIGIGEQDFLKTRLNVFLNKSRKDFRKAQLISNFPTSGFFALLNVGDLIAVGIGVYLFYNSKMTIGSIYLISNYVGLLNRPFIALRYEFENLQKIGASLNRIAELFALKSNISSGSIKLKEGEIAIDISKVSFSYEETDSLVLNNVSFKIKTGEKVGIVGKTGSGKSTLIRLIAKMYDLKNGQILFNNINIKDLSSTDFYKHVCIITQNSRIINGTVYENLTCFDSSIDRQKVIDAVEKVGLNNWLSNLKNGIDTVIDESMLSSGQQQLLYISRAFLQDADIYIFDEINSKLDENTEEKVHQALKVLTLNKTVFLIVHKLKLLEIVDKVLILENGSVKIYSDRIHVPNELIERNLES